MRRPRAGQRGHLDTAAVDQLIAGLAVAAAAGLVLLALGIAALVRWAWRRWAPK